MDLSRIFVCDIETIGYLEDISSFEDLHVFGVAYKDGEKWATKHTNKFEDIQKVVGNPNNTLVFHNGISYDKPVLEKMGFEFKANIIDTLGISYYLYPEKNKHGLAEWGEFFGVPKPEIESWTDLSYEEYVNRVTEDCKINTNLWLLMYDYLKKLYGKDEDIVRVINYLNFKMECLQIQEAVPLQLDIEKVKENLAFLENIISEKEALLNAILPKIPIKAKRSRPKVMFKKDGTLSAAGSKWMKMLKACDLPEDYDGVIEEIVKYEEPNCQSSKQMKEFLFDRGWKPKIFKDGANGKVPQLRDDNKELCPDIKRMIKEIPELEALDGLSVAQHRAGYLKRFLKDADEKGRARAWASGFTKTLRLKHTAPFVNLPKPSAEYGEYVRSCIVAPKGYKIIGADLSSIEDKTKQIAIYPLDPEYVQSMNTKGWDAHLALGLTAKMFTEDEVQFYKWYKNKDKGGNDFTIPEMYEGLSEERQHELFEKLDAKRAVSKTGNYALVYGSGIQTLMESTGLNRKDAQKLSDGYWELNWSVKKFAETRKVKTVKGTNWVQVNKNAGGLKQIKETNWIWNEMSNMWLYLKNDKDRFSAVNQNSGVRVFDTWCYFLTKMGLKISFQAHDEVLIYVKEEEVDNAVKIIKEAMKKVNDVFKPPVPLECDYAIGDRYSEVH